MCQSVFQQCYNIPSGIDKSKLVKMCTRYYIDEDTPEFNDVIEKAIRSSLYDRINHELGKAMHYRGEIRPTDLVPVIAPNRNGNRSAYPMKWGFSIKNSTTPIVNARCETASLKDLFKDAWKKHRCIIPASWYYEWEHFRASDGKIKAGSKYMIQPKGSMSTWLCGIYRYEGNIPVFAILTRQSSDPVAKLHDRMPLMLPSDKIDDWICPGSDPNALLSYAISDLFVDHGDSIPDISVKPSWWTDK